MGWDTFEKVVEWTWGAQADDLVGLGKLAAVLGAEPAHPFPVEVTVPGLEAGSTGKTIRGVLPEGRGVYAIGVQGDRHRVLYVGSSGKDDGSVRQGGVGDRLWNGLHAPPDWLRAALGTPLGSTLSERVAGRLQAATRKKRRLRRADLYRCVLAAFAVEVVTVHVWASDAPESVENAMLDHCRKVHGRALPLHGT